MTKISAFLPLPADTSKRDVHGGKNDLSSQHENWMRQMELSMMTDASQHGSFNASTIQTQKSDLKTALRSRDKTHEKSASEGNQSTAKRNVYPVSAAVKSAVNGETSVANPGNIHALAQSTSDSNPQEESSQTTTTSEQQSLVVKQNAGAASDMLNVSKRYDVNPVAQLVSGAISVQKIGSDVLNNKNNSIELSQVQAVSPRVAGVLCDIPRGETQEQSDVHAETQEFVEEVKSPVVEQDQDKQIWQKRMMHVTTDEQNVNVWIRDQEINAEQTPQLIRRLSNEMAESGLRLNGATINGKLVFKHKDSDKKDDEVALFQSDEVVPSSGDASERSIPLSFIKKGH